MTAETHTEPWNTIEDLLNQALKDLAEGMEVIAGLNEEVIKEESELQILRKRVDRLEGRIDAMVAVTPPQEVPRHIPEPVMRECFRTLGLPIDYPAFLEGVLNIAIQFILDNAFVEGENHRVWVIDQVLRILSGDNYEKIVKKWEVEHEGEDWDEEWDVGVAP